MSAVAEGRPECSIVAIAATAERDAYLPLLRLADDSEAELRRYYLTGDLHGLIDRATGEPVGHVLVVPRAETGVAELKSVAVAEPHQGKGLGRWLIEGVLVRLRAAGVRKVVVGTSNASLDALAFYQRLGFRLWRVDRDYFAPDKGYGPDCVDNGIVVRDLVWLDRPL